MNNDWLPPEGTGSFPATTWSMIERAQLAAPDEAATALNRLIARYWKPVFYYLRARGWTFQDAADLTQAFFARLVERDWLAPADPTRGRFRSFLLTVLNRFLSDQSAGRVRRQERFERGLLSIEQLMTDEDRAFEAAGGEAPDLVYLKRWATSLFAAVLADLKRLCEAEGRGDWYALFAAARLECEPPTQEDLAAQHGLTRDALRHRLDVLERRLARLLRAEVREQVGSEAELDLELAELSRWLSL
jgi:RNA polymerase sigma-70 factor (ECF subfamily)